jgi:predicted porin
VLATAGTAFAQSSVTLSGLVHAGYQKAPNGNKGVALTDYEFTLAASEDLGGGMRAMASMAIIDAVRADSTGFTAGNAGTTVNSIAGTTGSSAGFRSGLGRNNTTLGLAGGFGSVMYFSTRSGDLMTRAMVAPASLPDGIYDNSGIIARAPIDYLLYTSPNFGGFTGSLGYAESSFDGNVTPGNKTAVLGAGYANGPLAVGLAYKSGSGTPVAGAGGANFANTLLRKTNLEGFATYDLGVAKLGFGFDTKRAGTLAASTTEKNAFSFGVSAPLGPVTLGVNYAKRDTNKLFEAVAQYALSKRTQLNLSIGKQQGPGATNFVAPDTAEQGQYRIKLQHAF